MYVASIRKLKSINNVGAQCHFAGLIICASHRESEHFISNKNKCTVIYLCPCAFFESFRRDLIEAKAVYISLYCLICRFVIMTLRLHLKFRVTSLIGSPHGGRELRLLET